LAARRRSEEPRVRVAPLGELRAYTISEQELEKLEQGAPVSDLLTIGLCLLSAALTVLVTLLSTPLPWQTFVLFFCALLILGLGGAICTFLGWRLRASTRELACEIRSRMPEAPFVQEAPLVQPVLPPSREPPCAPATPPQPPLPPAEG
jgi:hypothetical protein